jgi:cold shock CspA family protein
MSTEELSRAIVNKVSASTQSTVRNAYNYANLFRLHVFESALHDETAGEASAVPLKEAGMPAALLAHPPPLPRKLVFELREDCEADARRAANQRAATAAGALLRPSTSYGVAGAHGRDDEPGDIFVHIETLRRCGVEDLQPGETVMVRFADGPKGLVVAEIECSSIG